MTNAASISRASVICSARRRLELGIADPLAGAAEHRE